MYLTDLGLQFHKDIKWVLKQSPQWHAHYNAYFRIKQHERDKAKAKQGR